MAAILVLLVLLVIASAFDLKSRRVPNELVVLIFVAGVTWAVIERGVNGAGWAFAYAVVGLALWLPLYALRAMGAGDVKLFAAASTWLASLLDVLLATFVTAVLGGILALAWALFQRRAGEAVLNVAAVLRFKLRPYWSSQQATFPYAVAITLGILWSVVRVHS